ncbi:putative Nodulation efficiency, NfeD [Vibrio nigripulchritudo MADA3029]|uniref:NfeD family protein n=1 Tax=Vibrio nigripulchritudo TaxID=28173 RepID=UPI0003B1AB1A|nr:NfeD family protein [Vibrio nigripulchritudo]CCN48114.1 putative Nodulation efficiency, NfeD [Vibrio nigripulchritudo MADA3020]CCN54971.1 putative Nodulation efficiency, NfeD [Vibrio nigripulchritudo MADA3021]CCN60116.1 putative Nodulation efficiency, NfeD [Vibrio nigripulchritudo MADA3029]
MFELLDQMNHWHWIALGLVLLCGELLGTAGYLLWIGISAILVSIVKLLLPMSWELQWVCFAVFSLVTTWLWWRYQHKKDVLDDKATDLNQKDKQLVGQITRLEEDIQAGRCRIRVGDTTWSAVSEKALTAGTTVKVTSVNGIILTIEAVD